MPELPEVQTTVDGLNITVKGLTIASVTTTYGSAYFKGKDEIKNPEFFKKFKKRVMGQKILKAERRAKNILIHLGSGDTILVHMKMTGYFHYDPKEAQFVRLDFTMSNGKHLVFSDMRKFGKVTVHETKTIHDSVHLKGMGPEPLDESFGFKQFKERLLTKPRGKVKPVLMDPFVIAGIGNIYSDEILWRADIHPLSTTSKIPEQNLKLAFKAMKEVLKKGIDFGGDSMSDYKNIKGEKGSFQEHHQAYKLNKKPCLKRECRGVIERTIVGMRSAHFCPVHQFLYK